MGEADVKLTTIIGTTIAAVGLAACGSTVTSTYHFTLSASAGQYGPLTAGT
jgi:hypothetical protein